MSQKASKEQTPALIAELVNRSNNIKSLEAVDKFLAQVSVLGSDAIELGQAIVWVRGVLGGEKERCAQIKAQLPDQDTEIKLSEADPEPPMAPAVESEPATSVGGVELSKGSEVLQPA